MWLCLGLALRLSLMLGDHILQLSPMLYTAIAITTNSIAGPVVWCHFTVYTCSFRMEATANHQGEVSSLQLPRWRVNHCLATVAIR